MATFISLVSQLSFFILLYTTLLCFLKIILYKFRQPPGPPTYPIIGCLISYYKNQTHLLDWYTQLVSKAETNTIVVDRLGARRMIITANPQNVEYMLKTNFNNFPKGKPFTEILGDFLGCGIFNVDGELWHSQRKLASHEFTAKSLREFFIATLEEEVDRRLLPVLESLAETGDVFDLQELLRRLAFNMVCKVSLGVDPCGLHPGLSVQPLARAFDTASEICARRSTAPIYLVWKIKRWLGIGSEKMLKDAVQQVHQYVAEVIIDRKRKMVEKTRNNSSDLLSRLILAGHEEKLTRDMLISFIMAGRDTTSAAMTWLFWLLSCHPEIEKEVVKETLITKQKLDYASLKELRSLKACLRESMRLYPPIAWDSKHALTDDLLPDNTPVRAGDRVTYFPYGMGRMEALWGKDWPEFKPDRWFHEADKSTSLKKVCSYKFPIFHAGPRACLGKQMAFIQMKYVVTSILRQFEIRPVSSDKPVYVPRLTAHMAGGLKVVVRKRTQNNHD